MDKQRICSASGEKYTSYASAERKCPDGTARCPVCKKAVKLRKQGLDRWPGTIPNHQDDRGTSSGRGSSYPVLPGRKIGANLVPVSAPQPPSTSGRMSKDLRDFIEGMSVSVDVSTGDHDADHRLFGTISEVMDEPGSKHGVILLMHDQEPNFDPPSASGERETVQCNCPGGTKAPGLHAPNCPVRERNAVLIDPYDGGTWVAPSPGIDAAEQKPVGVAFLCPSKNMDKTQCNFMRKDVPEGTKLYAAPPAAQPSAEWMAEAESLLDDYRDAIGGGTFAFRHDARAALLAHLRTKPSTEPWCDTMDRPKSKCGCPDCGPSLIDLGPGLRNTPGKP